MLYSDIQIIFDENCIQCHYQGSNLISYESYDNVMSGGSVVGNDLLSSSLYDRINREESDDGHMPPIGSLTIEQIELIELWINDGAPE